MRELKKQKGEEMKLKSVVIIFSLFLVLSPLAFSQSRDTGAIVGTVLDEEKSPLPGATVTLQSPNLMGVRTTATAADGSYRFPALPPGTYTLKAELPGFRTVVQENIRLSTTIRLTVDLTMKLATLAEEVTVIAKSPTVDVKSSETASVTLSNEILRNIPYSQFTSDIVNLAPGVTPSTQADVAYGAQDGTGIAYSMDGVNVADPEAGTAWVFLDHNIIEEAKVMGLGLPAEYGNFTGVIFNLITKSGGNEFSGHFEFDFQGKKDDKPKGLWQTNNNQAYIQDFPKLTSPLAKLADGNVHLGGPIKMDKLWFFAGLQYYRSMNYPTGFPEAIDYKQPRSFLKINSQLSSKTSLIGSLEVDTYNGINRGGGATVSPEATVNQTSPEVVGNFSLTQILSPKTFLDLKASYFWGYYYLEPETGRDVNAHFSDNDIMLYDNSGYYYLADRTRLQANASLTHYTENFITGSHDFKFGVEIEHSWSRSQYGFTGQNHTYYEDYWGYGYYGNYMKFEYEGYDFNVKYTRLEGFAQDSWKIIPRLNLNFGVRLSQNWGTINGVPGVVYNTHRIAPRVGFTFDLFGDKSTIFKAHYGQFTEGMFAAYHERLTPKWADYITSLWDLTATPQQWVEIDRVTQNWKLEEGIKHPYMDQFTASIERELFKDTSFTVSFIYRNWKNQIGVYDTLAQYAPYLYNSPDGYYVAALDKVFTVYQLTSGSAHEFLMENMRQGADRPYVLGKPYRRYTGLEFLLDKRFSNRWQVIASYVYSQTKGTIDNGQADDVGWNARAGMYTGDPNYWTNADGYATFDPTHMIKIQGTYILPFEISLSAYFRGVTGPSWNQRFRTRALNQGRVTFNTEPRGTYHYPMEKILDLRLEKIFTLAKRYRLGLIVDVFNVFNADTITSWGTRIGYDWLLSTDPNYYQSTEGHNLLGIVRPRQARVGIRLIF
jgi:hypothetical protein